MTMPVFVAVLEKFVPYLEHIKYLSLFGWGEPLLDRGLANKVRKAKRFGFKSIGFATNCTELDKQAAHAFITAGLDTIICSVDGITKATHEAVRVGTDFDKIVHNIQQFIALRSLLGRTKVVIRFIRQKANEHEWEPFKKWWEKRIDRSYGDTVISFDVVDCDNKVTDYKGKDVLKGVKGPMICDQINNRMIVFSTGDVTLCCGDDDGRFNLGNVLDTDPMEIYNGNTFTYYRNMMKEGRIISLEMCSGCTIPRSTKLKEA